MATIEDSRTVKNVGTQPKVRAVGNRGDVLMIDATATIVAVAESTLEPPRVRPSVAK
jgi:hypothetical protein